MGKLSPFLVKFLFRVILCYDYLKRFYVIFFPCDITNLDYWIIVMYELFKLCKIID